MRSIFLVIIVLVAGCRNHHNVSVPVTITGSKDITDSTGLIPKKVREYLETNFAGWSIPDTADYKKCWWSFYERTQVPYYVTTDLNDDKLPDYALILKNVNTIRLVILVGKGNTFTNRMPDDFCQPHTANDIQFGLAIEPPGLTDCIVDNIECSITIRSNAIALMELECKSKYYYWQDGIVKSFRLR
jgi:hypothetical protein